MKRRAYTLVELAVALMVLTTVLVFLHALTSQSAKGAAQVGATEETVRALATALEAVRRDVRRLVVQVPKNDLAIAPDGHSFSLRLPSVRNPDFWKVQQDVVSYAFGPALGRMHALMRVDSAGPRSIGGGAVSDLAVCFVPAGKSSRYAGYLSVTLFGPPAPPGQLRLSASALLPVTRVTVPLPFKA